MIHKSVQLQIHGVSLQLVPPDNLLFHWEGGGGNLSYRDGSNSQTAIAVMWKKVLWLLNGTCVQSLVLDAVREFLYKASNEFGKGGWRLLAGTRNWPLLSIPSAG